MRKLWDMWLGSCVIFTGSMLVVILANHTHVSRWTVLGAFCIGVYARSYQTYFTGRVAVRRFIHALSAADQDRAWEVMQREKRQRGGDIYDGH